jgi:hypothetical protein
MLDVLLAAPDDFHRSIHLLCNLDGEDAAVDIQPSAEAAAEQMIVDLDCILREAGELSNRGLGQGQLADERLALLVALWVGVTGSYFEHGEHVELLSTSQCDPAQAVRVVVAYVNQNANRMHKSFEVLAVESIRDAWPCK